MESEAVQLSLFDRHLAEVRSPDYPGERVCHNPLLSAAEAGGFADGHRRSAGRDRPAGGPDPHALISDGDRRESRPRKNRFQVAKHFRTQIADGSFHYERRTEAIIREAQLDGFYMLRTSEPADRANSRSRYT